ncbi:hypothetical protein CBW65_06265 [Tumebacillus avium]|uniref:AAA+ ATPase domain-containing protein n=1 Tax=Tumebacillus avium TaxID=1903704 RepID=A0A1Y0IMI0_9BACL|nr:AAA family ATPase [Tumebacillus avium]ARU60735.1 hypothetical protein CBW65_06265 [Tumebacillus avium]
MRIDSIQIKNFRLFEEKEIHFNPHFTLIIGENGTGKTTLLEALRVGVGGFLLGLDGVYARHIQTDDIRVEWEQVGDATVTKNPQVPVVLRCQGHVCDLEMTWEISKDSQSGRTRTANARELVSCAKGMQNQIVKERNQNVILPVISFQSAGRLFSQKKNKWVDPFKKDDLSRFLGYTDCLESESNIKLFVNWLRKMTTIKVQKNKKIGELDAVVHAVEQLLRLLLDDEQAEVHFGYDFEEEEVVVEMEGERSALRVMSSGYRTVIGMVADLAYRMALLNPQLKESAIEQTPGVVLIDELDLHLHPKWQWKIIESLKKLFPKVQFIATTHAPIVISSCADAELIDLHEHSEDDVELTQKSPYGWLMEDILTFMMDTHGRTVEVEEEIAILQSLQLKKLKGTLSQEELELLKETMRRLSQLLPESDPAISFARMDAIEAAVRGDGHGES